MADRLTSTVWLLARDQTPGDARRHVRHTLTAWGLVGAIDLAELLVSELVTNAHQHATMIPPDRPRLIGLIINWIDGRLFLAIHDDDPRPPLVRRTGPYVEPGRGLLMVKELSAEWGHYRKPVGKAVWCEVPLT